MHFDHAGIATTDADGLADRFAALLDVERVHEEPFDGMHVVFLDVENGYLELLEPETDDGAVARYLEDKDGGIHHVAFATEDVDAALDRAREHGVELIDEEPRDGAWGHDVAFCHPKSTGGVLVEFVQH